MTSAEIRQSFLDFFKSKQHAIVPSSSLMPTAPNLLFTNAGMNQFVPYFLGDQAAPWKRVADTQKCIRAGGKHNDLEDVGFDTYHHTMFEMLGNWSFGDYFKKESIQWGWELLTKVWGMPPKRLFATVYAPNKTKGDPAEFDQEAYDIWAEIFQKEGLDPAVHIVHGNKKDNFWMMGDTGPCGPCSEIHFNLLPSDDETAGRALVNSSSPRCIEIWNHVFIQFNANADGTFVPLAAKHVDTGMGFERVAGIHATTKGFKDFTAEPSNYNADVFKPTFDKIEQLTAQAGAAKRYTGSVPAERTGLSEQQQTDIAFRVLADHARCVSCAIADGIMPGNADRNYVIRRILRRGIMYGRKNLGLKTGFFEQLVAPVIESLGNVFPELKTQRVMIERAIRAEEESFGRTLDRGLAVFTDEVAKLSSSARSDQGPGSARVPRAASGVSPDGPENIRYSKRRLPHFERPWGKYHVAFSTHERRALTPDARRVVLDAILHGHHEGRYHLFAAAVMPDHVHLLFEPQPKAATSAGAPTEFHSLTEILHSLKSFTAHAINKAAGTSGSVWEKESFDRLIRSESDLVEKFNYIADNPHNMGVADSAGNYPYLWLGDDQAARRDAEQSPRDAGAPRIVPGHIAFQLYDTYGFPLDMTQLLAAEHGLTVDVAGFDAEMEKQRERGRAARKTDVIVGAAEGAAAVAATKFEGYGINPTTTFHAHVTDVVKTEKDTFLVFDTTPFYAEMGGQVGDSGAALIGDVKFEIFDTIKDKAGRHLHRVTSAETPSSKFQAPSLGAQATLHVDFARRRAISRHHSAAHLIHWALRKILGTHVRQFGTHKTADRLRFDFTHFEALTSAQIKECEQLINGKVIDNAKVECYEIDYDQKPDDVLAFFGDKYGTRVRIVDIGGFSRELCGGTHVQTTGEIGFIKIVAEMAIAAGTRRIEAVAGQAAFDYVAQREAALAAVNARLNAGVQDVAQKLESVLMRQRELEQKLKAFEAKASAGLAETLAAQASTADGLKFVRAVVTADTPEALRSLAGQVLNKIGEGVVVLGAAFGDKASVVAFCSPAAVKAGHQAGKIITELSAQLGGKGGGKPDFAMGGGKDPAKLAEVLA